MVQTIVSNGLCVIVISGYLVSSFTDILSLLQRKTFQCLFVFRYARKNCKIYIHIYGDMNKSRFVGRTKCVLTINMSIVIV